MPESLDIYDTNVWIFGLHDPDSQAGTLVQEAIHGNRRVRLNAYLYQEVVRNLDDGLDPQASKQITTAFATFVKESETIFGPTQKTDREG